MKIGTIARLYDRHLMDRRDPGAAASSHGRSDVPPSRALVPVAPAPPGQPPSARRGRAAAPFLAHLAATRLGLPQTRARRRAGAAETVSAYERGDALDRREACGGVTRKIL